MASSVVEWCGSCRRLVEPGAVVVDRHGTHRCPLCRAELEVSAPDHPDHVPFEEEHPKAPWHFKVLLLATVGYLIYRAIWIVQRLTHHG